jgi:hypothetical protein
MGITRAARVIGGGGALLFAAFAWLRAGAERGWSVGRVVAEVGAWVLMKPGLGGSGWPEVIGVGCAGGPV